MVLRIIAIDTDMPLTHQDAIQHLDLGDDDFAVVMNGDAHLASSQVIQGSDDRYIHVLIIAGTSRPGPVPTQATDRGA